MIIFKRSLSTMPITLRCLNLTSSGGWYDLTALFSIVSVDAKNRGPVLQPSLIQKQLWERCAYVPPRPFGGMLLTQRIGLPFESTRGLRLNVLRIQ
jgi:hypothetical protein